MDRERPLTTFKGAMCGLEEAMIRAWQVMGEWTGEQHHGVRARHGYTVV